LVSPGSTRVVLMHRWAPLDGSLGPYWLSRLVTIDPDGSAWTYRDGAPHYYLYLDLTDVAHPVGAGHLTKDGHCSHPPGPVRERFLSDTYPGADDCRELFLYDPDSGSRTDLGRFYGPTPEDPEVRCDLHPRWSRDGRQVCIDSLHEGTRQVYVLDLPPEV